MQLIYILTYNCNFKCKYCDVDRKNNSISEDTIDLSLDFLKKNSLKIDKVKFFGGEPLLKKKGIRYIVNNFPNKENVNFYITTNTSFIDEDFVNFAKRNNITLTFSIDGKKNDNRDMKFNKTIIENVKKYRDIIRVNQVITSENALDFFKNFKFIYNLGVRNFNFLPAYYKYWTKEGLGDLNKGFYEILKFYKNGNDFNLVNLENYSEVSFFNLGIIIDTDGKIYITNIFINEGFEKYKKELEIGDVKNGFYVDITGERIMKGCVEKIWEIVNNGYNRRVLKSVKYVNLILNNFCNEFKTYRA